MATTHTNTVSLSDKSAKVGVDAAKDDVAKQLEALKADFAGLAAAVQTLTTTGTHAAKETVSSKVQAAGDAGEVAAREALERVNEGSDAIAAYAREKPMMALAVAAGAGLLIGFLTAPRK